MQEAIREGTLVFANDGTRIGEIKEIRGDIFKVDALMEPDFWLRCKDLHSDGPDLAHVEFAADEVKQNLAPPPQ